jgi:glutamate-5-semialdehyde dehydrogenase
MTSDIHEYCRNVARRAKKASEELACATGAQKEKWLHRSAHLLNERSVALAEANRLDIAKAPEFGLSEAAIDRLRLTPERIAAMAKALLEVAALPEPIGRVISSTIRPNGLEVQKVRVPLGVVFFIYESRPNVTVDAAALCVKAGNAVVLRGGSEAIHTNVALGEALRAAARDVGVPEDAIAIVAHTDRTAIDVLLRQDRYVDLIIPRGGPALIRKVTETSTIPVIKHDAGVCHVFLDASADPEMAAAIVRDSKIRQVSVCNGLETLLAHRAASRTALPHVLKLLHEEGVEIRGCAETCAIFPDAVPAEDADWGTEYLDKILAVRVVPDFEAAVAHIQRYGSDHTEVIVTSDYANAQRFLREVNSSVVGVNCSTAFSDGQRLGLGAEIGISTSRLHAYGPMGLESLTTQKFVLYGEGQLRE